MYSSFFSDPPVPFYCFCPLRSFFAFLSSSFEEFSVPDSAFPLDPFSFLFNSSMKLSSAAPPKSFMFCSVFHNLLPLGLFPSNFSFIGGGLTSFLSSRNFFPLGAIPSGRYSDARVDHLRMYNEFPPSKSLSCPSLESVFFLPEESFFSVGRLLFPFCMMSHRGRRLTPHWPAREALGSALLLFLFPFFVKRWIELLPPPSYPSWRGFLFLSPF